MESLKEYNWDTRYSSATHNLIEDFFIPALARSKSYYRIAGYFSSTSIAAALRGVSAFVKNGEKMYLVIGSELTQADADAINKGIVEMKDYLEQKWDECIKDLSNDIIRNRFEALSWLIANNKLEIRIGVNKDSKGNYLSADVSKFHEKILIFEDYDGNRIQIDGSINETWKAWKENRESFCVHKSWIDGNEIFIETAKKNFDKVWLNLDDTCEVMDLPEAIKKKILSIIPKNKPSVEDEIDFLEDIEEPEEKNLRKYQEEAIQSWTNHNYIGILEMATGTGKTFTALSAIKRLNLESKLLLIGVPQKELASQWVYVCESVLKKVNKRIIPCFSDTNWKDNLQREIRQSQRENSLCIIISVFNTMRTQQFLKKIVPNIDKTYLIVDEVHEIGSSENRKILPVLSGIKYRLGLSATPNRLWDDEGNEALSNFFNGNPIFKWDMEKAIHPPEGYEPCLCEYKYYIHECNLNKEELENYENLSKKISRRIASLFKGGKKDFSKVNNDNSLNLLMFKRAEIIKKCENKSKILDNILTNYLDDLKKCLIYCNDKNHMEEVSKQILSEGFQCRKFFGEMDSEERERVFNSFEKEDVRFLVAIKCLDQGIDLPICNSAIILASSKNPREYVQRRGRILRLHDEKPFSIVHDILVLPYPLEDLKSGKKTLYDFEANILKNQIERLKIFAENSLNSSENYLKILDFGNIITQSN